MRMAPPFSLLLLIYIGVVVSISLISSTSTLFAFADAKKAAGGAKDLVRSSCIHASYPNICIRTLSTYAGPAPKTPRDLAQAAVKVSLSRARNVSEYLLGLQSSSSSSSSSSGSKREKGALTDCVEQIHESVVELSNTLEELKHLRRGTFTWQMNNAETWVSAALTNEDTCLDGFTEIDDDHHHHHHHNVSSDVNRLITNVARVTSNALYLINRLDQSRFHP